jgi:hypothetical protein
MLSLPGAIVGNSIGSSSSDPFPLPNLGRLKVQDPPLSHKSRVLLIEERLLPMVIMYGSSDTALLK